MLGTERSRRHLIEEVPPLVKACGVDRRQMVSGCFVKAAILRYSFQSRG